jgi:pimeloyl-ACP methyl ester carboxylesterase
MDLPCEDGSASFDVYADAVCASLAGSDDDVVLVGHSLGGHTVPLVAECRAVRHVVYLCGVVPDIGRSVMDQLRDEPDMLNPLWQEGLSPPDVQTRTTWLDFDVARRLIFHDCDDQTAIAAFHRLRPQALYPQKLALSLTQFPTVPSTYVVCNDDQFLRPEWSKRVAHDRLGAELIELPGGHSPLLSRPQTVVDVLLRVAEQ